MGEVGGLGVGYTNTISILSGKGRYEMQFIDRESAGQALAHSLKRYKTDKTVVVALPRGGVVLGYEIAKSLDVPLGLVLARNIGHPANSDYTIAAVAEGEPTVYSGTDVMPVDDLWLTVAVARARHLIAHQRRLYFTQSYDRPGISGSLAILVNDGMATGLTMQAATRAISRMHPAHIVVAVPVASKESIELMDPLVDDIVVVDKPLNFLGLVRSHYLRFPRINDMTVRQLLERSSTYGYNVRATINP